MNGETIKVTVEAKRWAAMSGVVRAAERFLNSKPAEYHPALDSLIEAVRVLEERGGGEL